MKTVVMYILEILFVAIILTLVFAALLNSPAFAMPYVDPKVISETVDDVVMPPTGTGSYVVCVDDAKVYGGPHSYLEVRYTLPRGTVVNVRERAKWTMEGWGMIQPAYWISSLDICK